MTGPLADPYVVEKPHTYTGAVGTLFTATLTCVDTLGGATDSASYFVRIQSPPPNLPLEVNVAIDEGLWYLHKTQVRYVDGGTGLAFGSWTGAGYASSGWVSVSAANVNAFESNGHLESGDPSNPNTDTVARGLRYLFSRLTTAPIGPQTNGLGTFNPDANGNGYAAGVVEGYQFYQGGMVMDAIVGSRTPAAITASGPVGSGTDPGIRGRSYAANRTGHVGLLQLLPVRRGRGWRLALCL